MKVSQKHCLGTSIESFTSSSPSEQIIFHTKIEKIKFCKMLPKVDKNCCIDNFYCFSVSKTVNLIGGTEIFD